MGYRIALSLVTLIKLSMVRSRNLEYPNSPLNGTLDYSTISDKPIKTNVHSNMIVNEHNGFESANYDWRNLPSQMVGVSKTLKYAYDASGNRVKKSVSGGGNTTFYVRGANGEVITWFDTNYNYNFPITTPSGEMIGVFERQLSLGITERRYFLKDHLGSVRTTVNQNGAIDGYDDYYPFGLAMPGRSSNSANPNANYKFTGHERDDEAGLTLDYMMARNYDPMIGRFLQIDPLADQFPGWSPYNYVFNNPLNYIDPNGMSPVCGEKNNCDETYRVGSEVENKNGKWEYLGDNEWKRLSYGADNNISAEDIYSLFDSFYSTTVGEYNPEGMALLEEQLNSNMLLSMTAGSMYKGVDALYIYATGPFDRNSGNGRTSMSGRIVTGSELTDKIGDFSGFMMGKYASMPVKGVTLSASQFSSATRGTRLASANPQIRGGFNRAFNRFINNAYSNISKLLSF